MISCGATEGWITFFPSHLLRLFKTRAKQLLQFRQQRSSHRDCQKIFNECAGVPS